MPNQNVIAAQKNFIYGKYVIEIDPAKAFHQAAILDSKGIQIGRSVSFKNSHLEAKYLGSFFSDV